MSKVQVTRLQIALLEFFYFRRENFMHSYYGVRYFKRDKEKMCSLDLDNTQMNYAQMERLDRRLEDNIKRLAKKGLLTEYPTVPGASKYRINKDGVKVLTKLGIIPAPVDPTERVTVTL